MATLMTQHDNSLSQSMSQTSQVSQSQTKSYRRKHSRPVAVGKDSRKAIVGTKSETHSAIAEEDVKLMIKKEFVVPNSSRNNFSRNGHRAGGKEDGIPFIDLCD